MSRRLLVLMGLAVVSLALYHASGYGFSALFFWTDRYMAVDVPNFDLHGSVAYYGLMAVRRLAGFGVMAFLFVSGYFIAFAAGKKQTVSWQIIRARVNGLIWPYLFWSLAIFAFQFVAFGRVDAPLVYGRRLLLGEVIGSYYYIPLLIQLYVLSPFLVPLARDRWKLLLTISAAIQLTVQLLRYFALFGWDFPGLEQLIDWTPIWFFPIRVFWFTLGMVFGFHYREFRDFLQRTRWMWLGAAVTAYILTLVEYEWLLTVVDRPWIGAFSTVSTSLYALTFIVAFIAFDKVKYPYAKQLSDLGAKAFGIYLLHDMAMNTVGTALYFWAPWVLGNQLLYQGILIAVGLFTPLALMTLVQKTPARRSYKYLFG